MSDRLKDKVTLITGAGSGIGRACARLFAVEGASVVGVDVNQAALAETSDLVERAGGRIHVEVADLIDERSVARLFDAVSERYDRLDVLHNCVGGSTSRDAAVDALDVDTLNDVINLEL